MVAVAALFFCHSASVAGDSAQVIFGPEIEAWEKQVVANGGNQPDVSFTTDKEGVKVSVLEGGKSSFPGVRILPGSPWDVSKPGRIEAMVMSARAAELLRVMPFKAPADMSKFLLSPMPGLLVDVAVQPGQKVQAGERVAVIEAMKMENVLFAAADGVVGKVLAAKGESVEGKKAVGVRYRRGTSDTFGEVFANEAVVVSAGTANTAKLLQLSGIGPGELLRQHGCLRRGQGGKRESKGGLPGDALKRIWLCSAPPSADPRTNVCDNARLTAAGRATTADRIEQTWLAKAAADDVASPSRPHPGRGRNRRTGRSRW